MSEAKRARTSMCAITVPEQGDVDKMVWDEGVDVPTLGEGQVMVDVAVAGVNYIDTYQRSGLYPLPAPHILGREGSGVVSALGDGVSDLKVGDRVAFFFPGGYAAKVVVPALKVIKLADSVSMETAASAVLQGLTAHYLTHSTFPLKSGDTCLIHAGAGGTGALMIQMAKLRGARVLTTVSTAEKAAIAKQAGADEVINYVEQDFLEEVVRITDGKKVDVVYDGVGKTTWEKSMLSLRPRGMLVLFGNASGPVPPLNPLLLSKNGSLFVTRPTLKNYVADPAEFNQRCVELFGWLATGALKLRVAKTFPLREAGKAHTFLASRKAAGKILLAVNPNHSKM